MKNPFKRSTKSRGIPDWRHQNQQINEQMASTLGSPSFYPIARSTISSSNSSPVVQPPVAYSYQPQPQGHEQGKVEWYIEVGDNVNTKGDQKVSNFKVSSAPNSASHMPQNSIIQMKVGNNFNEGGTQEVGNFELSNVRLL